MCCTVEITRACCIACVCLCVCIQQYPGSGNYSMSCRVYAAAAAAAAYRHHHSAVTDLDGGTGTVNYGRSCHESTFCGRNSTAAGLIGPGSGHCGPIYGYPATAAAAAAYGVYGADVGGGVRQCSTTAGFGGTGDATSRYLSCVSSDRQHHDLSLSGIDELIAPLAQPASSSSSSSSSSAALVELNNFVCRGGDRLNVEAGDTAVCGRLPLSSRVDQTSDSRTTDTSTLTRSSCLYSSDNLAAAAASGVVKPASSSSSSTRINAVLEGGTTSLLATSTSDKAKTSLTGSHRNNHIAGVLRARDTSPHEHKIYIKVHLITPLNWGAEYCDERVCDCESVRLSVCVCF